MKNAPAWIDALEPLAFPEVCQVCHARWAAADSGFACGACQQNTFPITPPWCDRCGQPFAGGTDSIATCQECHEAQWGFTQARSMMSARGLVREVVHRLKYKGHEYFLPLMDQWLEGCGARLVRPIHHVVPVPLHPVKERERGFNQAERLARLVAHRLDLVLELGWLRRIKYTSTQTNLSRTARIENTRDAFKAPHSIPAAHVLLVDDVMTTGATVGACAAALRAAGAAEVQVLTLARGTLD